MSGSTARRNQRVLVLAPPGTDSELAANLLAQADFDVELCRSIEDLAAELAAGAGAALIAEETLVPPGVWLLVDVVKRQPAWSDPPLLLLTDVAGVSDSSVTALDVLASTGNVTLVERPVRALTLLSTLRSALRARRWQYEVRDHLEERKRAEAERERLLARERAARADVEAANRAKDEFLAVLSHELRTPLQPILGWVKLLRQGEIDGDAARRGLETIERNASTQAQIIEDLLDISRVIAGKLRLELKPVSLQSAIRAAMDAVRPAADARRILVDTVLPSGTVSVSGDTHRLQQVVWNLLANAVAFTPEGGRITITLERSNTDAIMSVTDTGQGIQPEFLPYIFERFRQADSTSTRRHGGLGLGLAIVQHVVELHGGTVSAESAGTGRGATFTVRLPLLAEGTPVAGAVSGALRPVDTGGAAVLDGFHVLVVDDDADTCDLLAVVLGYYGAAVTPVRSADEALHTLDRMRPDVVVSDIAMPGVDGYELARRLKRIERERGWRLPALALTAHARAADTEQAFLAGFEACVAKPVEPAELAQVIARLAGRAETQGVR